MRDADRRVVAQQSINELYPRFVACFQRRDFDCGGLDRLQLTHAKDCVHGFLQAIKLNVGFNIRFSGTEFCTCVVRISSGDIRDHQALSRMGHMP